MTPQAWVPVFRTVPSNFLAKRTVLPEILFSLAKEISFFAEVSWSEDTFCFISLSSKLNSFFKESISGTILAILPASSRGRSKTLAVSRIEDFAAMVP